MWTQECVEVTKGVLFCGCKGKEGCQWPPWGWEQLCLILKRQKQLFSSETYSAFLFLFSLPNNLEVVGSVSPVRCKRMSHLLRGCDTG